MDRDESHNLPKMQIGFIDSICLPLYKVKENPVDFFVHVEEATNG